MLQSWWLWGLWKLLLLGVTCFLGLFKNLKILLFMMIVLYTPVKSTIHSKAVSCFLELWLLWSIHTMWHNECYHYILAMQTVYCDSSLNGSYIFLFPSLINRHFIVFTLLCCWYVSLHVGEWKPASKETVLRRNWWVCVCVCVFNRNNSKRGQYASHLHLIFKV